MMRDENGTNIAPTSAKKSGHSPSLNRQLFKFAPISLQPFSTATSTSSFTNTVFVYVSLPIRRMNVSARRTFRPQTDLM